MTLNFNSKHYVNPVFGQKRPFFDLFLGAQNSALVKIFYFSTNLNDFITVHFQDSAEATLKISAG